MILKDFKFGYWTDSDVFLADSVDFADSLGFFADSLTFRENLPGDPRRPKADDDPRQIFTECQATQQKAQATQQNPRYSAKNNVAIRSIATFMTKFY